jgi:kynureninase
VTDFVKTKSQFHLPAEQIYLDGNSLGPLPKAAIARVSKMMQEEWGELLITAWNRADWMSQPSRVGNRIGKLIGAPAGTVVMGDTLSIKVYQARSQGYPVRYGQFSD